MSRFARSTTILSAAMLLCGTAQAMEIEKFDRMAAQDQSDYIVVLIEGAQKLLIQSGKKDLADVGKERHRVVRWLLYSRQRLPPEIAAAELNERLAEPWLPW